MPPVLRRSVIKPIEQKIQVAYEYRVYFDAHVFRPGAPLFRDVVRGSDRGLTGNVFFCIDDGVNRCHPHLSDEITAYCRSYASSLALCGKPLILAGGEQAKNDPGSVARVQQAFQEAGLCRHSYVVAIGGGALLDMVGYAAGTAHRGVRLIRMPTTVLAQADAGLGVKNGMNAFGRKNFIGTFAPPWAVINDSLFLPTLSDRDWISGVAEAIKVALIKDAAFFAFIGRHADALRNRDRAIMERVIYRCASLHLHHMATSGDPFESGSSRPLDFGHWSAHKLEQMSNYRLRHGEAVAIGMAIDATYSHLSGLLSRTSWQSIIRTLLRLGFPLYVPELAREDEVLAGLTEFREHLGGCLTVMLLTEIGNGQEVHSLDQDLIRTAIARLRKTKGREAA